MEYLLGIDLGTTNCTVTAVDEKGNTTVIKNRDGDVVTPSAVYFCEKENNYIIGKKAKELAPEDVNGQLVTLVKRQMGSDRTKVRRNPVTGKYKPYEYWGRMFSPEEISSKILKQLKEDAETQLKTKVTQAVITCPAYFKQAQKEATRIAGKLAGFDVLEVITEPTAAALSYSTVSKKLTTNGKELKEVKFKATDNYDGDLTKKVKVDIEKDKVTFSVKDKSKNETRITKDIYYVDIKAPSIELNQGDVTLIKGNKYNELGAKATDDCDGDVTSNIKINSNVNTNVAGNYEVTYEVVDKADNKATVKRKVKIVEPNRGVIYLTFDDGPNEGTTNVILNILKEEGVKATFFVTNKGPDSLIKRESDEGHTVALHTASHDYARIYSSDANFLADLKSVSDRVLRITGKESKIMRFPGGSSNTISRRYSSGIMSRMTTKVHEMGYKYYDWDVSSGDAAGGSPSPDTIYNNVINSVGPNKRNIVLMHDIKTYTRDALRNIIRWGKSQGYTFVPITMDTEEHHQRVAN